MNKGTTKATTGAKPAAAKPTAPTGKSSVPENFQKKQKRTETVKADRLKLRTQRQTEGKNKKLEYVKRAQGYVKTHRERQIELIKQRRQAKASNSFFVEAESKVLLVVRIRGINHIDPRTKRILRLFRLRQINNAVFVRVNKATLNMLKHIDPYVTYGYPDRKTVSQLLYKRGYVKINGQRIPITSNYIIEAAVKDQKTSRARQFKNDPKQAQDQGVISIEDLIEEVLAVGPNFKQINNAIWPFKLNNPKGGFVNKRHPFNQGGDWGNRENHINELIRKMI